MPDGLRPLNAAERSRYSRQISIPGLGEVGQARLRSASALVTRAGGLGGSAAIGLAMAGIGRLIVAHGSVLIDPDLNRQLLFSETDMGQARFSAAKRHLEALSKFTQVEALDHEPDAAEALALAHRVDIVLSCPPGWTERFRLNRACVEARKPLVEAAMRGCEGTLTVVIPGKTPCLACIVPEDPSPPFEEFFPVLGAVSHALGAMAATEAIKVLTGLGRPLAGRMLHADLGTMELRTLRVRRRADCLVCGKLDRALMAATPVG